MDSLEPRQTVGVLFTEPPNATVVWGLYWGGGNRGFAAFIDGALVVHRHDPEDSFGLLGLFGLWIARGEHLQYSTVNAFMHERMNDEDERADDRLAGP
jgi:hypothetical protein